MTPQRPAILLALVLLCTIAASFVSRSQPIRLNGGNQTMNITTGIADGDPISVSNSVCSLRYRSQGVLCKITVVTSCPGQSFNLSVVATSVTRGVAAPQVSLVNGNPALDFITNIPGGGFTNATCTLQYTASATFSQGNSTEVGTDVHNITYTYQAQ